MIPPTAEEAAEADAYQQAVFEDLYGPEFASGDEEEEDGEVSDDNYSAACSLDEEDFGIELQAAAWEIDTGGEMADAAFD